MTIYFKHSTNNVRFFEIPIERFQQIINEKDTSLQKTKTVLQKGGYPKMPKKTEEGNTSNNIFILPCTSSVAEILAKLDELKKIYDEFGTTKPLTKHYSFIKLLATDAKFGIQQDWYKTEKGNPDCIFSDILDTEEHPLFVKSGRETRVYRWWAQPIISRTTDMGNAPLFDTLLKPTRGNPRPIAYRISKNGLDALKHHFGKRIIFRK
jgi:hypothetical protein